MPVDNVLENFKKMNKKIELVSGNLEWYLKHFSQLDIEEGRVV